MQQTYWASNLPSADLMTLLYGILIYCTFDKILKVILFSLKIKIHWYETIPFGGTVHHHRNNFFFLTGTNYWTIKRVWCTFAPESASQTAPYSNNLQCTCGTLWNFCLTRQYWVLKLCVWLRKWHCSLVEGCYIAVFIIMWRTIGLYHFFILTKL